MIQTSSIPRLDFQAEKSFASKHCKLGNEAAKHFAFHLGQEGIVPVELQKKLSIQSNAFRVRKTSHDVDSINNIEPIVLDKPILVSHEPLSDDESAVKQASISSPQSTNDCTDLSD